VAVDGGVLVGVRVVAYYAIKGLTRRTAAQSGPRATEILEERYARGEISAEEYRTGRETLETTGAHMRQG
jgi:uncharacterized membrane protein